METKCFETGFRIRKVNQHQLCFCESLFSLLSQDHEHRSEEEHADIPAAKRFPGGKKPEGGADEVRDGTGDGFRAETEGREMQ